MRSRLHPYPTDDYLYRNVDAAESKSAVVNLFQAGGPVLIEAGHRGCGSDFILCAAVSVFDELVASRLDGCYFDCGRVVDLDDGRDWLLQELSSADVLERLQIELDGCTDLLVAIKPPNCSPLFALAHGPDDVRTLLAASDPKFQFAIVDSHELTSGEIPLRLKKTAAKLA